jgi:cobalt-zinc-cadmium efflux system outer membrane protein
MSRSVPGGETRALAAACFLWAAIGAVGADARQHQHQHHDPTSGVPGESGQHQPALPETPASPAAPAVPDGPTYTLDDLERRSRQHSPDLAAAEALLRAAEGQRRQAGLLPNPVIGYTAEDVPLSGDRDGGRHGVFFQQEIPLGGKRALSREAAERELEGARIEAEAVRLRAGIHLRSLYARTLAAQERIAVRDRLAALGREAVEVTRQLYNTGAADAPDLLAIEGEASLLESDAKQARIEREALWAELQAAVADPGLADGRLAGDLYADLPRIDRAGWGAKIREGSPGVRRAAAGVARAESALARAKAVARPDLEVGAAFRKDREPTRLGGPDLGWEGSADLGVRVPLWDRNRGGIAAATAEVEAAQRRADASRLGSDARFSRAFGRYQAAAERVRAYREGVLEGARQAHAQYLEKYGQMMAAYPQVLVAERSLRQLEDDAITAATEAWEEAAAIQGLLAGETGEPGERSGGALP